MNTYRIENTNSGLILGEYQGETKEQALDAMARDAGYKDYADFRTQVGDDRPSNLLVTKVSS